MLWTDVAVVDGWGAGRPPVLLVSTKNDSQYNFSAMYISSKLFPLTVI